MVDNNEYPAWVCDTCGIKASKGRRHEVSTYHLGICGVCNKNTQVTEPRDFFYPDFK